MTNISEISARAVSFWRDAGGKAWFGKSDELDAKIRSEFAADIEYLTTLDLVEHFKTEQDVYEILGIIICIDQFRRNLYRGDDKSFSEDPKALALSQYLVAHKLHKNINEPLKIFSYMPYMHSEDLSVQQQSLVLFDNSEFAVIHYDLIKKYGRFPHRNKVLGRTSTPEELEFLKTDGFKG